MCKLCDDYMHSAHMQHACDMNVFKMCIFCILGILHLLPARASEQGNVIGLVSVYIYIYIYIYMSSKKIVIERTRDLIYLKFVATEFSPKIISPSAGENSGDSA